MQNKIFQWKKFRRWLLSIGLSIILWFFVTGNTIVVEQKTVDIEYRGLPDNVIMSESLQKINYTISQNPYYPNEVKVNVKPYVDIIDSSPGWHNFPIKLEIKPDLPTYENIRMDINTARVLLDYKSIKNVPIKPDIQLLHNTDFTLKNVRITPSMTQITGPEKILQDIKELSINSTTISHAGDFTLEKKVLAPSSNIEIQDTKALLQFSVTPNFITKILTIPIVSKNIDPSLSSTVSIKNIKVQLKGLRSQFDELSSNLNSILYVNLENINMPGNYPKQNIFFDLPSGMTILTPKNLPTSVDVIVTLSRDKISLPETGSNTQENSKQEIEEKQYPITVEKPFIKENSNKFSDDLDSTQPTDTIQDNEFEKQKNIE